MSVSIGASRDLREADRRLLARQRLHTLGQLGAKLNAQRRQSGVRQHSDTPVFSPHDVRHRWATLWHLQGVPVAEAASWLGHSSQEHLRTYAHVVIDRRSTTPRSWTRRRCPETPRSFRFRGGTQGGHGTCKPDPTDTNEPHE